MYLKSFKRKILLLLGLFCIASCGTAEKVEMSDVEKLSQAAETYVHLGLELGQYDSDYVDAYLGPKEWKEKAANPRSKQQLASDIATVLSELEGLNFTEHDMQVRHKSLFRNVRAMDVRARMINGETFSFTDEARLIYDVIIPEYKLEDFDLIQQEISDLLPGDGDLAARVEAFRSSMTIPSDLVEKVVDVAIQECRARSKSNIPMPDNEAFTLEYVTGKNWSGYNWYQGQSTSLMQINQDFPMVIDRAIDLGCHEGYPGHHVWNVLIEQDLVKAKGWVEFNLYPLFSPYGLIAEGSANYGIELAFPGEQKANYSKDVLYPLAGLDVSKAELLSKVNELLAKLKYAELANAQAYLDGDITREEMVKRVIKYGMVSADRAQQRVRFIEQYRAYVLNYSLGKDIVANYIERNSNSAEQRWDRFKQLLTELSTASDMLD
jgi:hypothetical protein